MLLGSLVFVAIGVWMIKAENLPAEFGIPAHTWGWICIIFFGLGGLVAILTLLPGSGGLMLDGEGFQVTALFRARPRWSWTDASGFAVWNYRRNKMIVFDLASAKGAMAQLNTALSGHGAGLPDSYGLSADDLARLMTEWQKRALASKRGGMAG